MMTNGSTERSSADCTDSTGIARDRPISSNPGRSEAIAAGDPAGRTAVRTTTDWLVVIACTAIMIVEGYDLLLYSNAIPVLLADPTIGVDQSAAGLIGSMIFLGMLGGGVAAGPVVRALGPSRTILIGIIGFTVCTVAVAAASDAWYIGAARLLAGLCLGVVLPAALTAARNATHNADGSLTITIVMGGIAIGAVASTLTAQSVLHLGGWRTLFLSGGIVGILLAAITIPALRRIETHHRNVAEADAGASRASVRELVAPRHRTLLALGVLVTFADLLTWYGVSTWLTQLMREFSIPLQGALQLMLVLNLGAVVGSVGIALLAKRLGTRRIAAASGVLAAVALLLIAGQIGPGWLLAGYAAVLGAGAISAQNLINSLVADAFPVRLRTTALGCTLGLGRLGAVVAPIIGGQTLAAGLGPAWVLVAFASAALLGAVLLIWFTPERVECSLAAR